MERLLRTSVISLFLTAVLVAVAFDTVMLAFTGKGLAERESDVRAATAD